MTGTTIAQSEPVLVAIDISKTRHEVLIAIPGKKRRRLTVLHQIDFVAQSRHPGWYPQGMITPKGAKTRYKTTNWAAYNAPLVQADRLLTPPIDENAARLDFMGLPLRDDQLLLLLKDARAQIR
jgi:hypothetical protein